MKALAWTDPIPLVHMGSAAEYGFQPEGIAITEGAIARPVGDYGRTKLVATELVSGPSRAGGHPGHRSAGVQPRRSGGAPANSLAGTAVREIKRALVTARVVHHARPLGLPP